MSRSRDLERDLSIPGSSDARAMIFFVLQVLRVADVK